MNSQVLGHLADTSDVLYFDAAFSKNIDGYLAGESKEKSQRQYQAEPKTELGTYTDIADPAEHKYSKQ